MGTVEVISTHPSLLSGKFSGSLSWKFLADAYKFVLLSLDNMHTNIFHLLKRKNSSQLNSNVS